MKKVAPFLAVVIIMFIGYAIYSFNQYPIKNNTEQIKLHLEQWLERSQGNADLKVIEKVHLKETNTYVILYELKNDNLGYAQLVKGWNNRYKIVRAGHGTNNVSYKVINTNKGDYGLIYGQNTKLNFSRVKANIGDEDYTYDFEISPNHKFIKYVMLPKDLTSKFPAEFTLIDQNGGIIERNDLR